MPIFLWGKENLVEVGPSTDGRHTFLSVRGRAVWTPPEQARQIATALLQYAEREEKGELHHVAGGRSIPRSDGPDSDKARYPSPKPEDA